MPLVWYVLKFKMPRFTLVEINNSFYVVDGAWTEWTDSSTCSVTCNDGVKEQVRFCVNPALQGTGASCSGPSQQTTMCNYGTCITPGN